jgi:hypothetical protein
MEKIADSVNNISLNMQKDDRTGSTRCTPTTRLHNAAAAAGVTRMVTLTSELLGPVNKRAYGFAEIRWQ